MVDAIAKGFCFKCQTVELEGERHVCLTAEQAFEKSHQLEGSVEPGESYIDPIWGEVRIPAAGE